MKVDCGDFAKLVYFMGVDAQMAREMLFAEFEAILDGIVPVSEYAGSVAHAVYLEVDHCLKIHALVLFKVSFDQDGIVDMNWDVPLERLASSGSCASGPDLGAGPIQFICQSRCPDKKYHKRLWDLSAKFSKAFFRLLSQTVEKNKLGLTFMLNETPLNTLSFNTQTFNTQSLNTQPLNTQSETRTHWNPVEDEERLMEDQRMKEDYVNAVRDQVAEAVYGKKRRRKEDIQQAQVSLARKNTDNNALKRRLEDKDKIIDELKKTLADHEQKIQNLHEFYKHKHDIEIRELNEILQLREAELNCRGEHERKLKKEIRLLSQELEWLQTQTSTCLLEQMSQKGLNLVTFQPGVGQINVPYAKLSHYLDNPIAYIAEYCGVSSDHYRAWSAHYQLPVCQENIDGEHCCHEVIPRVSDPADFVVGRSNRCSAHQAGRHSAKLKVVKAR